MTRGDYELQPDVSCHYGTNRTMIHVPADTTGPPRWYTRYTRSGYTD